MLLEGKTHLLSSYHCFQLSYFEIRFGKQLPGAFCCAMVPVPYSDKMESLESSFFADSSDFVCSVNRSRSPDAAEKVGAAGLVEALWEIKVNRRNYQKSSLMCISRLHGTKTSLVTQLVQHLPFSRFIRI